MIHQVVLMIHQVVLMIHQVVQREAESQEEKLRGDEGEGEGFLSLSVSLCIFLSYSLVRSLTRGEPSRRSVSLEWKCSTKLYLEK